MSLLYGMENASHDANDRRFLGKNIFTNAFPLSLANYLDRERGEKIPIVTAYVDDSGEVKTRHVPALWSEIIGTDPATAHWQFETTYSEYRNYTHSSPNASDVVVRDSSGRDCSAFEIKLVVVPTSGSAHHTRENQVCELVIRPASIEQLAFSIARSYGQSQRDTLRRIIVEALRTPQDVAWSDRFAMVDRLDDVVEAADNIIREGVEEQTPLVIVAEWRTEGQTPRLDEHTFDVFVVTDMALLTLFTDTARQDNTGKPRTSLTRPGRSLIWLIKSLYDYSVQGSLQFVGITEKLNFGLQSDKSAAFTTKAAQLLGGENFLYPRVKRGEVDKIVSPRAFELLAPERRLDGALMTHYIINRQLREAQREIAEGLGEGKDPMEVDVTE